MTRPSPPLTPSSASGTPCSAASAASAPTAAPGAARRARDGALPEQRDSRRARDRHPEAPAAAAPDGHLRERHREPAAGHVLGRGDEPARRWPPARTPARRPRGQGRGSADRRRRPPASAAYAEPPRPGPVAPARRTTRSSAGSAGPTSRSTSSASPTTPISGVGAIALPGASLYRETLPPVTGIPRARQASPRPRTASLSCQNASGRVGSPKLRQFVTPSGRAPVTLTLRVASATDIAAPRYGSRAETAWSPSVVATRARRVPFTRRTAAPRPGPATVFVWTWWSYCS